MLSEKTLQDHASALSFIVWRQALNGAIDLHADFRYDDDRQRVGVISELLAYQIQHIDRLCHPRFEDSERAVLLNSLCARVSEHMQENLQDIAGPGDYRTPFIDMLNRRFEDYSQFEYDDMVPAYDTLRYLGRQVLDIMGEDQTNRWIIEQIIDIEAPALTAQVDKSVSRLLGQD